MKRLALTLLLLPVIATAQGNLNHLEEDKYYYMINIGEVVMCPYLGPKMIKTFEKMGGKNIVKQDSLEVLSFELDTLYSDQFIEEIFIKKIGIPKWSIYEINILKNEK